jgi:hypothetical protein
MRCPPRAETHRRPRARLDVGQLDDLDLLAALDFDLRADESFAWARHLAAPAQRARARAAWTARTILGYVPHRHRLPLIAVRMSSSVGIARSREQRAGGH